MRDFDSIKDRKMKDIEEHIRRVYNKGYDDGLKDKPSAIYEKYKQGLNDAWDFARKICDIQNAQKIKEIFGADANYVLWNVSASEAIAKIKAWEEKKHEIKVGDEILCSGTDDKAVVTKVIHGLEGDLYRCVHSDGDLSTETSESKPTGRFFPEIAELFEKMQEGEE